MQEAVSGLVFMYHAWGFRGGRRFLLILSSVHQGIGERLSGECYHNFLPYL